MFRNKILTIAVMIVFYWSGSVVAFTDEKLETNLKKITDLITSKKEAFKIKEYINEKTRIFPVKETDINGKSIEYFFCPRISSLMAEVPIGRCYKYNSEVIEAPNIENKFFILFFSKRKGEIEEKDVSEEKIFSCLKNTILKKLEKDYLKTYMWESKKSKEQAMSFMKKLSRSFVENIKNHILFVKKSEMVEFLKEKCSRKTLSTNQEKTRLGSQDLEPKSYKRKKDKEV